MADYKRFNQKYFDDLDAKRHNEERVSYSETERSSLLSKNIESDETLKKFYDFKGTFRPRIIPKDPETFCFFSSAESLYDRAQFNILNYYPFDGTQAEVLEWHSSSTPLEVGIVEKHWPSSVGHLQITNREYLNFFGGPQKLLDAEFVGKFQQGETPLRMDFDKGNTVEFWMKKGGWTGDSKETIFEVGAHPAGDDSATSARASFKVYLNQTSGSSGSPIFVDYRSGSYGFVDEQIGVSLTNTDIADSKWHHYAFRGFQKDGKLHMDLFVDGKKNHSLSKTVSDSKVLGSADSFMAGTIGAPLDSGQGSFSGSLDEFRFWKGRRTNRELNRYFDQKVFASSLEEQAYTSRLGVYYKFNKKILGDSSLDAIVLDYSGNDVTTRIKKYSSSSRVQTSAIDASSVSSNTEIPDLSLLETDSRVISLQDELIKIGKSYDKNNSNSILKLIPDWANDPYGNKELNKQSDFYVLLNLIAEEFDEIKLNIDSIKFLTNRNFDSNYASLGEASKALEPINNSDQIDLFTCSDNVKDLDIWPGNRIDFPQKNLEKMGFVVDARPLELNVKPEDDLENIIGNVRLSMNPSDVKSLILDNVLIAATSILKKKGTERSFDQLLSCWGVDRDLISFNVYGKNSEADLDKDLKSSKVVKMRAFDFSKSPETSLYISSSAAIPAPGSTDDQDGDLIDQARYISGSRGETVETVCDDYTFEGNFIFPPLNTDLDNSEKTSIFGISSVEKDNEDYKVLNFLNPNIAEIKVNVRRSLYDNSAARFELTCSAGDIKTSYINGIYDSSKWNLNVSINKSGSAESRFISGSSSSNSNDYQIVFSGRNYVLDSLQDSFTETINITRQQYTNFIKSNKMVYVGADREDMTGSVNSKANFKFLNLKAWNVSLTNQEKADLSQNIQTWGVSNLNQFMPTGSLARDRSLIFKIDVTGESSIPDDGILKIKDFSSGSIDDIIKYGERIGSKYNFASTEISSSVRSSVLSTEYINTVFSEPIDILRTNEEVKVKKSELDKFDINAKDLSRVVSFEKSMYRHISDEMLKFLSGIKVMNNLIGEPINKYRPHYKSMNYFRQRFYENVENENQFERYVEYYRWIDHSLGALLGQIVPASAQVNAGLHNVVESHALERNKYQHKMPLIKIVNKEIESRIENTSNRRQTFTPLNDLRDLEAEQKDENARKTLVSAISTDDDDIVKKNKSK